MSCSKAITSISFAEIARGRESSVRTTYDGMIYAVDLTIVITGLERNQAGLALRRVLKKNMLSIILIERNTGGQGNSKTQLVNLKDALQLVMVLGGELAKETRARFASILQDFFAGEESLVDQVRANAASDSPIAQLARASLPVHDDLELKITRKRQFDREDALFGMEMAERKQKLLYLTLETSAKAAETQVKVLDVQKMLLETYTSLCPNMLIDDRARLMFKDNILNIAAPNTQLVIGNGEEHKSITISTVASALGCRFDKSDVGKIGKVVAAAYREKYGQEPGKHEQFVDGAARLVNSYTERDRGMVEAAILSYNK
jgi:hypothetical protein